MLTETIALILLMAQAAANPAPANSRRNSNQDLDRVICRAAEPVLGSRVARRRICRTVAQWQAFEADRQQLRRDLQDAAACGRNASCYSME